MLRRVPSHPRPGTATGEKKTRDEELTGSISDTTRCGAATSVDYTPFPIIAARCCCDQVYAVFGDFGLTNDESMADLVANAAAGTFDSVLHVGDFACECSQAERHTRAPERGFEHSATPTPLRSPVISDDLDVWASTVGNQFMNLAQNYSATKPTMPAVSALGTACMSQLGILSPHANALIASFDCISPCCGRLETTRAAGCARGRPHWALIRLATSRSTAPASTPCRSILTRRTTCTTTSTG